MGMVGWVSGDHIRIELHIIRGIVHSVYIFPHNEYLFGLTPYAAQEDVWVIESCT